MHSTRDAYLPDLAVAANDRAALLQRPGGGPRRCQVYQEAMDLRRELRRLDRDAYLPDTWRYGCTTAPVGLAEGGRRAEAVPLSQRPSDLYRELTPSTATPTCRPGGLAEQPRRPAGGGEAAGRGTAGLPGGRQPVSRADRPQPDAYLPTWQCR